MDKLLTIEQLADKLQVKKATIYSWTFTRKIPFVKVNGALRFKEQAISKWIDAQEAEAERN